MLTPLSMTHLGAIGRRLVLPVVVALGLASPSGAQQPQVIRGRVTTDSGAVIAGADVIVTIAPTTESISGKSEANGTYRIVIPNPTGEYILYIGAVGRKAFRQRVTIAKTDSVAVVDAKLASSITTVAAVQVQARKARPPRTLGSDNTFSSDNGDRVANEGVNTALSPDLQGNLDAMATYIPGLALGPNGLSAFGMGTDANSTTLNGLGFGGTDLPRGARTSTRFRTSVWDPTAGGFAGVQTASTISGGGNVSSRHGEIAFDAPALQFSDPVASRLGQKFTDVAVDEGGTGPYKLDKIFYNFGLHFERRTAAISSLSDLDADALTASGISPDSAARLLNVLGGLSIPIGAGGIPRDRTTTSVSYLERIDRAPEPRPASQPAAPILATTVYAKYSQSEANSLLPTQAAGTTGKTYNALGAIQGLYSRYFGKDGDYVSETTSGLTFSDVHGTPYLSLPGGNVLITSTDGIGSVGFGGNSALASDSRTLSWETINQTDFLMNGHESMPFKFYLQSRFDEFDQSVAANRLGSFSYASIADVAANRPSSFTRTLNSPDRSGGEWIGATALGGNYSNSGSGFSMTGGLRVDANVFTAAPEYNADLDRTFNARTDHAPDGVDISPRFGFNWNYLKPNGLGRPGVGNSVSISPLAISLKGAQSIRGGFGKFRSVPQPTLLANAISSTGLPGGMQQLLCIGSATPTPDWTAYSVNQSSIPTSCAGGIPSFTDTARAVSLFDKKYAPPSSWRGTLGWTVAEFLGSYVAVDATYAYNENQSGTVDLNFSGNQRFALGNEGNRPVYANAASIVPATGSVSPVDARVSGSYGRISDRVSDLHSDSKQIAVWAVPNIPFPAGMLFLGYSYADARAQGRGFDGASGGDPRAVEWAPGALTPRHQITVRYAKTFFGASAGFSAAFKATSGYTFTPTVSGDINGDGLASNDRAFIFNPNAATTDPAVASGLNALLQSGPKAARDCLASQIGTIAARNACVGPWFQTMNVGLSFRSIPRSNNRAHVLVNLANVTSALDEILHGSNLRGWGVLPLPDPTLYQVRGFDPVAQKFIYQVNPRFGSSSGATTTRRSPFRITLDVSVDLGRSTQEQQVEQNIRIRPSMLGTRASVDSIRVRFMRNNFSDFWNFILRNADSLALSRDQTDRIKVEQAKMRLKGDSVYKVLAEYLVALPDDFDVKEAAKHVAATNDDMWNIVYAEKDFLLATLTRGQILRLPSPIQGMITIPNFKGKFFLG